MKHYKFRTVIALSLIRFYPISKYIPDTIYLKILYWGHIGKKLDLKRPKSFNEKIQWLKIYDRKNEYSQMVDKFEVKQYVSNIIGAKYVIPSLGVWNSFDDIDLKSLPNQFVLKSTHDSGGIYICRDKSLFDRSKARVFFNKRLKRKIYWSHREWPYKNCKPRIIAEPYMEDKEYKELRDYKFFCFGGKVKCFKIDFDRFIEHHANYYDCKGNLLPYGEARFPPIPSKQLDMPKNLDLMISLAEKLSTGLRFIRVDFYEVDNQVFFGELTFFPASGLGLYTEEKWDRELGDLIDLPTDN